MAQRKDGLNRRELGKLFLGAAIAGTQRTHNSEKAHAEAPKAETIPPSGTIPPAEHPTSIETQHQQPRTLLIDIFNPTEVLQTSLAENSVTSSTEEFANNPIIKSLGIETELETILASQHGVDVETVTYKFRDLLNTSAEAPVNEKSNPAITYRFSHFDRNEQGAIEIWLYADPTELGEQIQQSSSSVVSMSLEVGYFGFTFTPAEDGTLVRNQQIDAYANEHTPHNVQLLAETAKTVPEKILVCSTGNPTNATPDIRAARESVEIPENLLTVGVFDNTKAVADWQPQSLGADIYVSGRHLKNGLELDLYSSYAVPVVSEALRHFLEMENLEPLDGLERFKQDFTKPEKYVDTNDQEHTVMVFDTAKFIKEYQQEPPINYANPLNKSAPH